MVRVPTPIPQYAVEKTRRFFSATLPNILWRLLLVVVGGAILYGMATSGTFALAFLASIVLGYFVADDIQQLAADIWYRNFWVWRS